MSWLTSRQGNVPASIVRQQLAGLTCGLDTVELDPAVGPSPLNHCNTIVLSTPYFSTLSVTLSYIAGTRLAQETNTWWIYQYRWEGRILIRCARNTRNTYPALPICSALARRIRINLIVITTDWSWQSSLQLSAGQRNIIILYYGPSPWTVLHFFIAEPAKTSSCMTDKRVNPHLERETQIVSNGGTSGNILQKPV